VNDTKQEACEQTCNSDSCEIFAVKSHDKRKYFNSLGRRDAPVLLKPPYLVIVVRRAPHTYLLASASRCVVDSCCRCECNSGYIGDGHVCYGNLLEVSMIVEFTDRTRTCSAADDRLTVKQSMVVKACSYDAVLAVF